MCVCDLLVVVYLFCWGRGWGGAHLARLVDILILWKDFMSLNFLETMTINMNMMKTKYGA